MRRGDYPDDWEERREHVLERDNNECQRCGATDAQLQVHHIESISDGGTHDYSNLQTVCRSCHAKEHPTQVTLSSALSNNNRIRMKYSSSTGTRVREVDPYALETHEGIQYLVGHDYYRDEVRHFRPTRIKWVEETDQGFEPPSYFDASSYLESHLDSRTETTCFIATAAYGTPYASDLDRLRAFRDEVLDEYRLGRLFIRLYYWASPPIASWIGHRSHRRWLVRTLLIQPVLVLLEWLRIGVCSHRRSGQ